MQDFFAELRRRNVFRVAAVYGVVGWIIAQVAVVLETALELPNWFDGTIVTLLLLGFPVALILAWAFELTADGFKPTEYVEPSPVRNRRKRIGLNIALAAALACALAFIIVDRTVLNRLDGTSSAETTATAKLSDATKRDASIAVLPFADMSATQDQVYLGDGIAEELLNLLTRVDGLRVASRTSAFSFRDQAVPVSEIADTLNVGHLLEGSVRRANDQVRIVAQLVDTDTDEQLWSQTFDRALSAENLFAIQDEIAQAIVEELEGRLSLAARGDVPTRSTESYEYFLSGRSKIETRRRDEALEGLEDLKRAVTLDPDFTEAHIALGRAYAIARIYAGMDPDVAIAAADRQFAIAEALDPDSPYLTLERAWSLYNRPDIDPQIQREAFEAAVRANPGNAEAYRGLSNVLVNMGLFDEAEPYLAKALRLDPSSEVLLINAGQLAVSRRRPEEARAYYLRVLDIDPANSLARGNLADLAYESGDIATAHRILKSGGTEPNLQAFKSDLYARLLMFDEVAALDPHVANGFTALLEERDTDVARAIGLAEADRRYSALYLLDIADQPDLYRDFLDREPGLMEFLSGDAPITDASFADIGLAAQRAFRDTDAGLSSSISDKVNAYFSTQKAADTPTITGLVNLARWQARQGQTDGMYDVLEAALDRNVPMELDLLYADFNPFRNEDRFLSIADRAAQAVAEHRTVVEAQLADPPGVWWSPETALPGD